MKYYVTYRVDARYTTVVEANSLEEARKRADANYFGADFGVIDEVVDGEAIMVEDADGNYIWENKRVMLNGGLYEKINFEMAVWY